MEIPAGYAHVCVFIRNEGSTRSSCVGFGVWSQSLDAAGVTAAVNTTLATTSTFKSGLGSNTDIIKITAQVGQEGGDPLVDERAVAIAGTGSTTNVAANSAVLVHKRTAVGGRKGRGRLFLPWYVADTNVDEVGFITPATVTTLQSYMDSFRAALNTNNVPMRLLHSPDKNGVLLAPTAVTDLVVDPQIATQRRRLGR